MLLNYSGHGLRRLMPRRPALALAVAVKLSFLVNGLFTLPAYLYPYQVWVLLLFFLQLRPRCPSWSMGCSRCRPTR